MEGVVFLLMLLCVVGAFTIIALSFIVLALHRRLRAVELTVDEFCGTVLSSVTVERRAVPGP